MDRGRLPECSEGPTHCCKAGTNTKPADLTQLHQKEQFEASARPQGVAYLKVQRRIVVVSELL